MMKILVPLLLLIVMTMPAAAADTPMTITASEWAQPRSGETLLRHPVLAQAVQQLQTNGNALLEIRYPGGDGVGFGARGLRAWWAPWGVNPPLIRLGPESDPPDHLQFRIRK